MAKGGYVGVSGVARKIKKGYVGVDNISRKIKKAYMGVGGVARLIWSGTSSFKYLMRMSFNDGNSTVTPIYLNYPNNATNQPYGDETGLYTPTAPFTDNNLDGHIYCLTSAGGSARSYYTYFFKYGEQGLINAFRSPIVETAAFDLLTGAKNNNNIYIARSSIDEDYDGETYCDTYLYNTEIDNNFTTATIVSEVHMPRDTLIAYPTNSLNNSSSLYFYNGYLYGNKFASKYLSSFALVYKINPSNGAILNTSTTRGSVLGIYNEKLLICDSSTKMTISYLSLNDLSLISSINTPSGLQFINKTDSYFYFYSSNTGGIYQISQDLSSYQQVCSWFAPSVDAYDFGTGICFINEDYIWYVSGNRTSGSKFYQYTWDQELVSISNTVSSVRVAQGNYLYRNRQALGTIVY